MHSLPLALRAYLTVMALFLVAPIAVVIVAAFTAGEFITFPPKSFSSRWFAKVLQEPEFIGPLWNSIKLGVVSTVVACLLAVPAVIALVRGHVAQRKLVESVLLAPLALPTIILAVGLLFFTARIGIGGSFISLLAGHVIIITPYVLRTVLGVYMAANHEIEDAARVLGAGPIATFRHVTLPMIRPGILAGGILAFLMSFDEVAVALLLSNSDTTTLPVSILSYLVYNYDPSVAAISTIQIVIVLISLLVLDRVLGIRNVVLATR